MGPPLALIAGRLRARLAGVRLRPPDAPAMADRGEAVPPGMARLALARYGEAIRLDPGCARAYIVRAAMLDRLLWDWRRSAWAFEGRPTMGDFAGAAVGDLDEAIRLEPGLAAAYAMRAAIRWRACPPDAPDPELEAARAPALADLDAAIRLEPLSAAHRHARGQIRPAGDGGELADFLEAARLDPGSARFRIALGRCRLERDDLDGAIADFTEGLRLDPRDPAVYWGRAEAYRAKGDRARADADDAAAREVAVR